MTSIFDYCSILVQRPPTIDAEFRNEALAIPIPAAGDLPIVLTGCDEGLYLPGIAGVRVFAGHWSLTPEYKAKCRLLEAAGLTMRGAGQTADADLLVRLVRGAHADYVMLPTGSSGEARLLGSGLAEPFSVGRRWTTVKVVR